RRFITPCIIRGDWRPRSRRRNRLASTRRGHSCLSVLGETTGHAMDQVFMTGFFEEVKRRKVYRVAAAYIIVAGGIIQILSATFPAWELPPWSLRLVILLLLVGFPIALILAWAYDITPQGIRATPETTAPRTGQRRNIIMLIATGVAISAPTPSF